MRIANLTQHLPTKDEITERSERLSRLISEEGVYDYALIGGAPYFMSTLERVLKNNNITPLYSFSKRVIKEITNVNETKKESIFQHIGFIEI